MNELIPKKFADGIDTLLEAKKLEITDEMGYTMADAMGQICKDEIKVRKAYFEPLKTQAHTLHKSLVAAEKESLKPYEEAKSVLQRASLAYETEQERIRKAEEDRLRKEAEQKEKIRQDALAEKERVRQEKLAEFKEQNKGAEVQVEIPPELEEVEEEIETFQPDDIVVAPRFVKQGQTRVTWKAEITNMDDFFRGVITNGTFDLILPNLSLLNAKAKEVKRDSTIPGVKFFTESTKVY